ncbi:hypothetical protein SAMN04488109_5384 [Chryseolinea serpens]|uniref:Uncharacterized protein n=1 Tax=Chryseolinea serpens TaxID=947013 RepID=A0A1M5VT59_9BACT|nr:hypothetical protein [Chryseolinea serpens]SHH78378.1 hypothetical protein SAMN04488109_5384 [Chryseolinea serpens]
MKKLLTPFFFLFAILYALLTMLTSCTTEDRLEPANAKETFSFSQVQRDAGTTDGTSTPAFVLLNLKDGQGNLQENITLALSPRDQGYSSEGLDLQPGNYELLEFAILDGAHKTLYATPKEGSALAPNIANPLPLGFVVSQNGGGKVVPPVLAVTPDDTPGAFGYTSFGIDTTNPNEVMLIKSNVKVKIGGVLYENVDAHLRVSGFDANNVLQWEKDFNFVGPVDNLLEVKNGFHHYSIALVDKWGTNDIQSDIPGKAFWEGRSDGPLPVTYVLVGSKDAKKLSSYILSNEVSVAGGGTRYQPNIKVEYTYTAAGHIDHIHHKTYNPETAQFEETTTDTFVYEGDVVSEISTVMNGEPYAEYRYSYGIENKIVATLHYANELVGTQTARPEAGNNRVNVSYSYSNGRAFVYAFDVRYKNIASDQTTQGQVCNTGSYAYDKNINPFLHLGYMDFDFENWPANNKVAEDVHYIACGFPSIIPVAHAYTYDPDGYPITKITTYKKGSQDDQNDSDLSFHTKVEYSYE